MKKIILYKRFTVFLPLFIFIPTIPVAVGSNNIFDPQVQNEYLIKGTLAVVSVITLLLLLTKKWKLSDIGFRPEKPFKGLGITLLLCLIGLLFAGPYARLLGFTETVEMSKVDFGKVIRWSLFYVVAQDFMYQSFLCGIGNEVFKGKVGKVVTIIFVILFFIWMHSIFHRSNAVMAFVAPGAVMFTLLYNKYKNLYLVFLIHIFYSLIAFYYTVFSH